MLFRSWRGGEIKVSYLIGWAGEGRQVGLLCPPEQERIPRGRAERHMPHFYQTPGLTRRARVPKRARSALEKPEASQGGLPRSLQVSTPAPSWETRSVASFEGTATDPSLPAGADNCLSSPRQRQRPARAVLGPEPATPPLRPHPSTDCPQSCPDSPNLAPPSLNPSQGLDRRL